MTQLALDSGPKSGETLVCRLTPSGRIDVQPGAPEDGPFLTTKAAQQIIKAFNDGRGKGVLHLGAAELLFTLRGVDPTEMVEAAIDQPTAAGKTRKGRVLETDELSSVFGVDIDMDGVSSGEASTPTAPAKRTQRAAKPRKPASSGDTSKKTAAIPATRRSAAAKKTTGKKKSTTAELTPKKAVAKKATAKPTTKKTTTKKPARKKAAAKTSSAKKSTTGKPKR